MTLDEDDGEPGQRLPAPAHRRPVAMRAPGVVDLEPDYQLVAVSEPRREYLWILARSPRVDPARQAAMVKRLAEQGFDVSRLQPAPDAAAP